MSIDHIHALPSGTLLEEYRLHSVLGAGGFGITYRAEDTHLNKVVAIKEYLPSEFATRTGTRTVVPHSGTQAQDYHWGLTRFLDEARALARFDHPHLNKVHRYFEANGTAYLVLEYIEGETLGDLLDRRGALPEVELRRLLTEVLRGLAVVHEAGYVHRDVKPGNLMLRDGDGSAVLLDFGAARQAVGQRSRSVTSILTPGYAPIEQYGMRVEDVGPWSDIYALGMVAYRCVSGLRDGQLPDAVTRSGDQRKGGGDWASAVAVGKGRYAEGLLRAIDWAVAVNEEDRPQGVAQWQAALSGEVDGLAAVQGKGVVEPAPPSVPPTIPQDSKAGRSPRFTVMWALAGVVALTLALVVYWFVQIRADDEAYARARVGTVESLEEYLQGYPAGRHADEARSRRQALIEAAAAKAERLAAERELWELVKDSQNPADFEGYLSRYLDGTHAAQARSRRQLLIAADDEAYARARSAGTVESLEAYLRRYPAGRHADEIRRLRGSFSDELGSGGQGPEMVVIPAGRFRMGCVSGRDCRNSEKPVHEVRIAKSFALSKYEVTFAQWDACVVDGGCGRPNDRGWGRVNRPVIDVSWNDAMKYVKWLSRKTGKRYRLPSEAEWEYAARAGTTTKYSWGNDIGRNRANCDGCGSRWDNQKTASVGSFPANGFGLYDMHGNVSEWTQDCWHEDYQGAPSDGSAWTSGGDCGRHVLRGGSSYSYPSDLRAADRSWYVTFFRDYLYGFRVARTLAVETVTPEPAASAVEAGLGLTRVARRQVQQGLTAAGFNPGLADGLFGVGTRSALRDWQASRGEAATGYLDAESAKTLSDLGSEFVLWESVKGSESPADFEGYLTQYPDGTHADEARSRRQALIAAAERELWESVKDSQNLADFEGYLSQYPDGTYADEARSRREALITADDTAYARARSVGTVASLGAYLRRYPNGVYADEARSWRREALIAADDEAYARARSAGTVATYGEYLQSYPAGRHADEARRLQTEVKLVELRPGQLFSDELGSGGQGPEMVVLPAGGFRMGCVSGRDCEDNEMPVHEVRIAQPFALSKYEVTRGEFGRFVAQAGYRTMAEHSGGCYVWDGSDVTEKSSARWNNPGFNQSDTHPVVCVSWDDAVAYVEWLSSETGKRYRLPSEAEWEYAARSGSTTKYHFGDDESQLCWYANHADKSTDLPWHNESCSDGIGARTAEVGSYQPNSFGLHDMHGNVLEWVQDCWNDSYAGAPSNGSAWTSGDCGRHVLRGGSWLYAPEILRAAFRGQGVTDNHRGYSFGFRVARTLTP